MGRTGPSNITLAFGVRLSAKELIPYFEGVWEWTFEEATCPHRTLETEFSELERGRMSEKRKKREIQDLEAQSRREAKEFGALSGKEKRRRKWKFQLGQLKEHFDELCFEAPTEAQMKKATTRGFFSKEDEEACPRGLPVGLHIWEVPHDQLEGYRGRYMSQNAAAFFFAVAFYSVDLEGPQTTRVRSERRARHLFLRAREKMAGTGFGRLLAAHEPDLQTIADCCHCCG